MLPPALVHGMLAPGCCFVQTVSAQSSDVDGNSAGPMRTTSELSKVLWTIHASSRTAGPSEIVSQTWGEIER